MRNHCGIALLALSSITGCQELAIPPDRSFEWPVNASPGAILGEFFVAGTTNDVAVSFAHNTVSGLPESLESGDTVIVPNNHLTIANGTIGVKQALSVGQQMLITRDIEYNLIASLQSNVGDMKVETTTDITMILRPVLEPPDTLEFDWYADDVTGDSLGAFAFVATHPVAAIQYEFRAANPSGLPPRLNGGPFVIAINDHFGVSNGMLQIIAALSEIQKREVNGPIPYRVDVMASAGNTTGDARLAITLRPGARPSAAQ